MTKSEAFRRACERNALRREGKLPLIPMAEAMEEELRRDAIRVYDAVARLHQADFERIKADVTAALQSERGPDIGRSAAGRWLIRWHAHRQFDRFLRSLGFARPLGRVVVYGSNRAMTDPQSSSRSPHARPD
jgi:hypothetical protein